MKNGRRWRKRGRGGEGGGGRGEERVREITVEENEKMPEKQNSGDVRSEEERAERNRRWSARRK